MKVREYSERLKKDIDNIGERKAIEKLAFDFLSDLGDLMKNRKCQIPSAVKSCIDEIMDKWNRLSRLNPIIKRDGLMDYLLKNHFDLCAYAGISKTEAGNE